MRLAVRRSVLALSFLASTAAAAHAQSLADRVQKVMARPEFAHAIWGVEFYDLDAGTATLRVMGDKLFMAASTTKLLTVGTALHYLGPDYRFHTKVYRTGPIGADGTLDGDLVLVASGDANLSGRILPNGTLDFRDDDHAYGGDMVPGDPLAVIKELAAQIAAKGVKRVHGRVLVDASLFPTGDREGGSNVVISPIVVNDNVIDIMVTPGATVGAPATAVVHPYSSYLHLTLKVTTDAKGSAPRDSIESDVMNPDGSRSVTIAGSRAVDAHPTLIPYPVADPIRFAEVVLAEALHERGILAEPPPQGESVDYAAMTANYTDANAVAEHVSPPFKEDARITLKVSQNLHASMLPYVLSALIAKKPAPQAGFDLEREWLTQAGLDLGGAAQGDGAGAHGHFSPDFMVRYLAYVAKQPFYQALLDGLPILGKDGTLYDVQVKSAAAGHVHAKTGTFDENDLLNKGDLVTAKGLAGYFTRADGRKFAFAIYVNRVELKEGQGITAIVGQALGEIAGAGYVSH